VRPPLTIRLHTLSGQCRTQCSGSALAGGQGSTNSGKGSVSVSVFMPSNNGEVGATGNRRQPGGATASFLGRKRRAWMVVMDVELTDMRSSIV
jgi:hypothetical protein